VPGARQWPELPDHDLDDHNNDEFADHNNDPLRLR